MQINLLFKFHLLFGWANQQQVRPRQHFIVNIAEIKQQIGSRDKIRSQWIQSSYLKEKIRCTFLLVIYYQLKFKSVFFFSLSLTSNQIKAYITMESKNTLRITSMLRLQHLCPFVCWAFVRHEHCHDMPTWKMLMT